jgi:membrane fusion protein (multidrug efflux system)
VIVTADCDGLSGIAEGPATHVLHYASLPAITNARANEMPARTLIVTAGISLVSFFVFAGGCAAPEPQAQTPPPTVKALRVEQTDVPVYGEWIGTLDGMVNAEIKAQVSGYLLAQHYTEGSLVKKGQLLFALDPRPFEAVLDQAKGQLAQANAQALQAEANQGKTQLDVERYVPLAKEKAVTEQDLDNAVQANLAAKAQVEAAKAGIVAAKAFVETAQLNLGFTSIRSPIDGIAGLALTQVGNFVNAGATSLTTVSTVDPIKAYFTATEQEYLRYIRMNPIESEREAHTRELVLELVLADGTVYPHKGQFYVADRQVNPQTGAIRLAGVFANPGNILRPGQYGRVRAVTEIRRNALLVPQRAVTELQGRYQVAVVDDTNTVRIRPVTVGERSGSMWIIEDGLKPGERIVVEGLQQIRPNLIVKPEPFVAPAPASNDRK